VKSRIAASPDEPTVTVNVRIASEENRHMSTATCRTELPCSLHQLCIACNSDPDAVKTAITNTPALFARIVRLNDGMELLPSECLPQLRAVLAAQEQRRTAAGSLAPLERWIPRPSGDDFDERHLALAQQFMREHAGASWEQCSAFARANWGKEAGADVPVTFQQAERTVELLREGAGGRSLLQCIQLAQEERPGPGLPRSWYEASGDRDRLAKQNAGPPPTYPQERRVAPSDEVIIGPKTMPSAAAGYAAAKASAAEANELRLAWENLSRVSQRIGLTPQQADAAMRYQAETGCTWDEAVKQVRGEREFTEADLAKAQQMMRAAPDKKWSEIYEKLMGRLPD
jgi:hypothetical protein